MKISQRARRRLGVLGFLFVAAALAGAATTTPPQQQPRAARIEDLASGVQLALLAIPAGSFMIGSPAGEAARNPDEGPQSRVEVAAFWLGKTEVTQAQYAAVMETNPSVFKGADLPVDSVNWREAMEFCRKLSQRTGRTYTLPTEAQWEYAARGGENRGPYSFGDAAAQLGGFAWNRDNSAEKTHPVGGKTKNPFGLYDMEGNVWEWCLSRFLPYPYIDSKERNDPASAGTRVLRGGSWVDSGWGCRDAYRYGLQPDLHFYSFGFRVAGSN